MRAAGLRLPHGMDDQVDTVYLGNAYGGGRLSAGPLALVLAAHALALWGLAAQRQPAPPLIEHPILVSLVAEARKAVPEQPQNPPPPARKPLPQRVNKPDAKAAPPRGVAEPEPPLAARTQDTDLPPAPPAQTSQAVPPQPQIPALPEPEPVRARAPESAAAPVSALHNTAPAEAAPEAPIESPSFSADYLSNPAPSYPPLSRRLREEGRVLLRVRVDADGNPAQLVLQESSGFSRLDERAMETVRRWKFVPARQAGSPVEAWVVVPIQFSLKGK